VLNSDSPHTRDALSFLRMYILLGAVKLLAMVKQIVQDPVVRARL